MVRIRVPRWPRLAVQVASGMTLEQGGLFKSRGFVHFGHDDRGPPLSESCQCIASGHSEVSLRQGHPDGQSRCHDTNSGLKSAGDGGLQVSGLSGLISFSSSESEAAQ
jgi:hypothetical protein